jgi:Flp pilus assembly protein TadD
LETKDWGRVIDAAQIVCSRKPGCERAWIAWAYALRELQRVEEAKDVLLRAEQLHPRCGVLHYNLACYYCLLGDQVEAERRLTVAGGLDDAWLQSALEDPDLRGMRSRLASQD